MTEATGVHDGARPARRRPPPEAGFGDVIGRLAEADPEAPALTCEDRTVTWSQLERRSNRLARAYRDLGVGAGALVTIGLPNGIEFVEATLAVWKLGATPQPISPRLPGPERESLVALANPRLVVGADDAGPWRTVAAGFAPDRSVPDGPLPPAVPAEWKALASGGSTGRPKLIVATQPGVYGTVASLARLERMTENGVHLATGPLSHNAPFFNAMAALMLGCHVVLMPRFRPEEALRLVQRHRVDWMYAVPTMMQRIWRLPTQERLRHDLSSLRTVMHLGAPCPPWLKQAWIDWLGPDRLLEVYAATEVQALTLIDGGEWLRHRGSVGRPVIGQIRVLDEAGDEVPPGTVGELWMRRGPGEPRPYRYVGASARSRPDGWESVGDLGWCDDDGYLYLADRQTDMILVGGSNVYPAEVEAALEAHPGVQSACVVGIPDDDLGSVPYAVVQLCGDVPDEALVEHLRSRLARYKVPRSFHRVDEPLRDEAGKVRRSAWRARAAGDPAARPAR